MLGATRLLIEQTRRPHSLWTVCHTLAAAVARRGTPEDADALWPVWLERRDDKLLGPIGALGDEDVARRFGAACRGEARTSGALRTLGTMGWAPARDELLDLLVRAELHHDTTNAVYGLLHLPSDGIEAAIEVEVRQCLGEHLFKEFVPALTVHIGRHELLDQLLSMGHDGPTSRDCLGGILLALALGGRADDYWTILTGEGWEVTSGATGIRTPTYTGFRLLRLTFRELLDRVRASPTTYGVEVFLSLLEDHVGRQPLPLRFAPPATESALELATLLYEAEDWAHGSPGWSDRLFDQPFGRLKDILADRVVEEVEEGR